MKKTKKTSLIAVSFLAIIFIFLTLAYLWLLNNPKCYDREQDQGWECFYSSFIPSVPEGKDVEYQKKCEESGGEYHSMVITKEMTNSGDFRMTKIGPHTYCTIPLSDYETPCNSSDECKGECEYVEEIPNFCVEEISGVYNCSKEIKGQCSKTKSFDNNCINGNIVNGNSIESHSCIQ